MKNMITNNNINRIVSKANQDAAKITKAIIIN